MKARNEKLHNTSDYEVPELVIRRGFSFKLMMTLSRPLAKGEEFDFEFRAGGRPMQRYGSLIPLPLLTTGEASDEPQEGYRVITNNEHTLAVEISTSAKSTGVGKWLLAMKVRQGRRNSAMLCPVTEDIIVVFNPWCKHDSVYMQKSEWRDEYVLNEEGLQYYGTSRRIGDMDWYFGQFEDVVVRAVLKLLQMVKPTYKHRNDPVMIARHMSALVNSQDDNGVLEGNWSGDYSGGSSPTKWKGSVAILKQYVETGEPVKYGQCWVFSGVLTTVMRCLGIPARSLTNFDSAHDTDANLTIDYHYDAKYKPMDNDDSVWNFHVWNDVWMGRDDLAAEGSYGGWQAIDATPQEESSGVYRCGPAPLNALRQGRVDLDFDGKFIYAEVNASKKHWVRNKDAGFDGDYWLELRSQHDVIGRNISTKAVGSFMRHDITDQYKHPEGSEEERLSFQNARKRIETTHTKENRAQTVEQQLDICCDGIPDQLEFGKDLNFTIDIKNKAEKADVHLSCVTKLIQYNGPVVKTLRDEDREVAVESDEAFSFCVPASHYTKERSSSENNVKIVLLCGVPATGEVHSRQFVVDFVKPVIDIEGARESKVMEKYEVTMSFTNPLDDDICGYFVVEGAALRTLHMVSSGKIAGGKKCSVKTEVVLRKVGKRRLIVSFDSDSVSGIRGSLDVNVTS